MAIFYDCAHFRVNDFSVQNVISRLVILDASYDANTLTDKIEWVTTLRKELTVSENIVRKIVDKIRQADGNGNITSYARYDSLGNISSRVDIDPRSASHFDKATGQYIPAPHVVEYPTNVLPNGSIRTQTNAGVVRAAKPEDIP